MEKKIIIPNYVALRTEESKLNGFYLSRKLDYFKDVKNTNELLTYISACDVMLFPYTVSMSSSGPMAIGSETSFLASDVFAEVFDQRVLFSRTAEGLTAKVSAFFEDRLSIRSYVRELQVSRTWEAVGQRTEDVYRAYTI